jgi:hypothetical protein
METYYRIVGLILTDVAVDGCITKATQCGVLDWRRTSLRQGGPNVDRIAHITWVGPWGRGSLRPAVVQASLRRSWRR